MKTFSTGVAAIFAMPALVLGFVTLVSPNPAPTYTQSAVPSTSNSSPTPSASPVATCPQTVAAGGTIPIQTGSAQPVTRSIGTGRTGQQGVFNDAISLHESAYFKSLGCASGGKDWLVVEFKDKFDLKFATTITYSYTATPDPSSSSISITDSAGKAYNPVTISTDPKSGSRTAVFAVPENKTASYQVAGSLAYTATRDTTNDTKSSDSAISTVPKNLASQFDVNASAALTSTQTECQPFETAWC
ncbi:hypothetical protein ACVXZ4_04080 [Lacisediminihabitans sp. FW035]